jgi:hypothetical protein
MTASEYMHKVTALTDAMAAAGSPLSDEEVIDQMLTGLGPAFNPIAASLGVTNATVTLDEFYSMVLNYEALQQSQQLGPEDRSSSANAASRQGMGGPPGSQRAPDSWRPNGGRPGGSYSPSQPAGSYPQQGPYLQQGAGDQRRPNGNGNGGRPGGGNGGGGNGRNGGGGGGNGRNRWRPKSQICKYWGHDAADCRSRYDARSGNAASTSSSDSPPAPWYFDTGATDHLTSELECLQVHERYGGKDQVQVANGTGLSISHIGHSNIAGSSIRLNNILHVPHIRKHLLSVYRLVYDNDIFIEFHRHFFLDKDKATRKVFLRGRSKGGLYPLPFSRATPPSSHHASPTMSSEWHQRLGHPTNKVVESTVRQNNLECSKDNSTSVCDACQC